ncbi:hypothetical protein MnTg02_03482 [bacterium MnTg02]|nr:hypothetical protein MnTg02_03482 [bacterium MnTg02]
MNSCRATSRRSAVKFVLLGLFWLVAFQTAPSRSDSLDSGYESAKPPRWSNRAHYAVPPISQEDCANSKFDGDLSFQATGLRRPGPRFVTSPSFDTLPADIEPFDAPRGRQSAIGLDIHLGQMRTAGKDIELSVQSRIAVSREGESSYKGASSSVRDCHPSDK